MKKFVLAAPLVGVLMLGGCATTGDTSATIEQIRQAAVSACGFLPTIETVASILAAGNPAVATGSAVAQAICAAVTSTTRESRRRGAVPTVNGVVIHGKFVR